mgnify:CR=1 FL=1
MPPYKKPVSRQQAKFFGAIAGGQLKIPGFSAAEAGKKLKGTKMKSLPKKAKKMK